jgi:hypothetical protein
MSGDGAAPFMTKRGCPVAVTAQRGATVALSWLLLMPVMLMPVLGSARAETESQPPRHIVTGILSMLDLSTGKGMLKTDLDKPIFFEISRPDLFSHVSIGDRVTIQLDDEGKTMKVIEDLPSELSMPAPSPAP